MDSFLKFLEENCPGDDAHSGCAEPNKPLLERCELCASIYGEHLKEMNLQVEALQKQLRTAQEVINKHATDGIEGLHCVDCVAEDDEMCDCPMLVPFWEAMKGYTEKRDVPIPVCAACHGAFPGHQPGCSFGYDQP